VAFWVSHNSLRAAALRPSGTPRTLATLLPGTLELLRPLRSSLARLCVSIELLNRP
jgi:hypothetical protein